jgi:hypothetical protein
MTEGTLGAVEFICLRGRVGKAALAEVRPAAEPLGDPGRVSRKLRDGSVAFQATVPRESDKRCSGKKGWGEVSEGERSLPGKPNVPDGILGPDLSTPGWAHQHRLVRQE